MAQLFIQIAGEAIEMYRTLFLSTGQSIILEDLLILLTELIPTELKGAGLLLRRRLQTEAGHTPK